MDNFLKTIYQIDIEDWRKILSKKNLDYLRSLRMNFREALNEYGKNLNDDIIFNLERKSSIIEYFIGQIVNLNKHSNQLGNIEEFKKHNYKKKVF